MKYDDAWRTDSALLEAIEAVSGGDFDHDTETCAGSACDGHHPELCSDPAVVLWRDGGRDKELCAYLDEHNPGWRDEGLWWGDFKYTG